jgi:hypothetical protein
VNHLHTISDHFVASLFNISTRASVTGGIAHQLKINASVNTKSTFSISHGPQAFATGTSSVSIANDNADFDFFFHISSWRTIFYSLEGISSLSKTTSIIEI